LTTTKIWECTCLTANYTSSAGKCIPNDDVVPVRTNYPLENARTISYDFVESRATEESNTFS